MKIDQENIEEWMFEYFEGNLSEDHKTELLLFIHENPEYEKDFVQWAQSYAHIEEVVPNYGIAAQLLRKPPFLFPFSKLLIGSVAIVGVVSILWRVIGHQTEKKTVVEQENPENTPLKTAPSLPLTSKGDNSEKKAPSLRRDFKSVSETMTTRLEESKKSAILSLPENEHIQTEETEPASSSNDLSLSLPEPESLKKEQHLPTSSEMPDTVASLKNKNVLAVPKAIPSKKPKRKLPLNLNPSSDFMPVNDNF